MVTRRLRYIDTPYILDPRRGASLSARRAPRTRVRPAACGSERRASVAPDRRTVRRYVTRRRS